MSRPFVVAHVSDLHVSTFGDTYHDSARIVRRSARPADTSPARWKTVWEEAGWRVLSERQARRPKLQLLDPEGYSHPIPSVRKGDGVADPIERAASKACRLEARRATTLAKGRASEGALEHLLRTTPKNSNVRLLQAARFLERADVDLVAVTGDLTDDGAGYELVEAAFEPWRKRGHLLAVPGNHDLYLFPIAGSARPRPTLESKRAAWRAFAARLGLTLHASGAWQRALPEARTMVVGLDSCARSQPRFFRHNGAIGPAQLAWLREIARSSDWKSARHRLVLLHHHVVPLPHGVGRGAPTEIGMRLDDARTVAEVLDEVGATVVMHGHRHVSEHRQPAGTNFRILATPSLTLGCRSGDAPSYWRLELAEHAHATRVRIPVAAVAQNSDPQAADGQDPAPSSSASLLDDPSDESADA